MSAPHSPARQRRDALRGAGSGTTHPDGGALRILVIDGDDAVARRSQSVLEAAGFEVATADLPDIGIVRRVAPDAIVLSLFFRGQASGLDFLERHMADPVAAATPIIVHGPCEGLDAGQMRRLRAAACPAAPNALLDQIAACLRPSSPNAPECANSQPAAPANREPETADRTIPARAGVESARQADERVDAWEWEGGALDTRRKRRRSAG